MKGLSRHIAATTLFGASDPPELDRLGRLSERWIDLNNLPRSHILQLDIRGTAYAEILETARQLEQSLLEMIRRRRGDRTGRADLLSALVHASDEQGGIPERNLVGRAVILFVASHETTAYALSWTLFLLSQHPEVAERLLGELRETLGGRAPQVADLPKLVFLGRVIQESLRLIPVVPYTVRVASRPARLDGLHLPQGSRVFIPFDVMHRRAEVFSHPNRFDPDRWASDAPPPYTYAPFGVGLHMCIGASFAMQTLKLTLSMLLQCFAFACLPGTRVDRRVTVTTSPRRGLPMELRRAGDGSPPVPVSGDIHQMVELPSG